MTQATDINTATLALLAALDTYREQVSMGAKCCHSSPCNSRKRGGYCGLRYNHCPSQIPATGNWLPVAVAAEAVKRAVEAEKPDLFEEDEKADGEFHAPCGQCAKRYGHQSQCRPCRHYIT